MKVGLIGAGRQGWRRAQAVRELRETELAIVADTDSGVAKALAKDMGCEVTNNWEDVVGRSDLEAVIICTPNHLHAPLHPARP